MCKTDIQSHKKCSDLDIVWEKKLITAFYLIENDLIPNHSNYGARKSYDIYLAIDVLRGLQLSQRFKIM